MALPWWASSLMYKEDYHPLIERMNRKGIAYTELNKNLNLFNMLI